MGLLRKYQVLIINNLNEFINMASETSNFQQFHFHETKSSQPALSHSVICFKQLDCLRIWLMCNTEHLKENALLK